MLLLSAISSRSGFSIGHEDTKDTKDTKDSFCGLLSSAGKWDTDWTDRLTWPMGPVAAGGI